MAGVNLYKIILGAKKKKKKALQPQREMSSERQADVEALN